MKLFSYYRSSASYRVRIALHLKGLAHEQQAVHLVRSGGEQRHSDYLAMNPQGLVPTLVDQGHVLQQSLAIIEYLEEVYPDPPLLPKDPFERAYVRALSQVIACDTHPLNNLKILKYLRNNLDISEEQKTAWYQHWVAEGLASFEALLVQNNQFGQFCLGDMPTMADCCLIPQIYNAQRFNCDLTAYPTIRSIVKSSEALEAFYLAAPEQQADCE